MILTKRRAVRTVRLRCRLTRLYSVLLNCWPRPPQHGLAGGGRLVQAAEGRLVGRALHKLRVLFGLPRYRQHRLAEGVQRLFPLRLRRLHHQRLVNDEREVDRGRVEAVVDEPLGDVQRLHGLRLLADAGEAYRLAAPERSIGRTTASHGNFGVLVRALTYIRSLGAEGLRAISENAVINANYVQARLRDAPGRAGYNLPYDRACMHEVVFAPPKAGQRAKRVKTLDVAKRLIDYGFHPPTIYFPLIVDEALMVEPTESEGKEALDAFCEAMLAIAREAEEDPDLLRDAPHEAPLRSLDEATAARRPVLRWQRGAPT